MTIPEPSQTERKHFAEWLLKRVVADARGDDIYELDVAPSGRFWLGRLAPEEAVEEGGYGGRLERLDPCEIGIRTRPVDNAERTVRYRVEGRAWVRRGEDSGDDEPEWVKTSSIDVEDSFEAPEEEYASVAHGRDTISSALEDIGAPGLSAEVRAEVVPGRRGSELVVTLVNTSPAKPEDDRVDANLYEVRLTAELGEAEPFVLDALPTSFRYDRRISCYGVNCGVERLRGDTFRTSDLVRSDTHRPKYWDHDTCSQKPDLRFESLAHDPVPSLRALATEMRQWGSEHWSEERFRERMTTEPGWDEEMLDEALNEARRFRDERGRLERGIRLLEDDSEVRRAFRLMNEAFSIATRDKAYDSWRPFQIGSILSTLPTLGAAPGGSPSSEVDTLWFATGGGKTETYLGLVVTAAFLDRLKGKSEGITAWARFPLRMLSLQQTQRFADILAAAETVRREHEIEGEPYSLGFLVGRNGTPNRIRPDPSLGQPDPQDPSMPERYQVLLTCPFCGSDELTMEFDDSRWTLDHCCQNGECSWEGPLPFRIVDDEIYRFLPTAVVGTIDKAANVSMQAAMRGFYGAPEGECPDGHGFTYAPRGSKPNGCLHPGCDATPEALSQEERLYPPAIRVQDELHLLRDTLGAVDTHYEALLDHLQEHWGEPAKIIASSATLQGHDRQVERLYQRDGRVFPIPGPEKGKSFWTVDTDDVARIYVGVAPRGVTLEFAADRINETLQKSVRSALRAPATAAAEIGVRESVIPELGSRYGVHTTYGSTLRDVEAAARSFQTELRVDPVRSVTLTGRTPIEEVRQTLRRLENPEEDFDDRLHLIAASSMLSHGVDVDRLNVMVMLGLPLTTAEFIQTTSRVGRRDPGLVLVLHKIGRERDAAVYRSFDPFIQNADRLVDPVPITNRSRRVLEVTFPGLVLGRLYGIHEPESLDANHGKLTTVGRLKRAFEKMAVEEKAEYRALVEMLDADGPLDEGLRHDLEESIRAFFYKLNDPATDARFPKDLLPSTPMLSLRDVEEQVPVFGGGGR